MPNWSRMWSQIPYNIWMPVNKSINQSSLCNVNWSRMWSQIPYKIWLRRLGQSPPAPKQIRFGSPKLKQSLSALGVSKSGWHLQCETLPPSWHQTTSQVNEFTTAWNGGFHQTWVNITSNHIQFIYILLLLLVFDVCIYLFIYLFIYAFI